MKKVALIFFLLPPIFAYATPTYTATLVSYGAVGSNGSLNKHGDMVGTVYGANAETPIAFLNGNFQHFGEWQHSWATSLNDKKDFVGWYLDNVNYTGIHGYLRNFDGTTELIAEEFEDVKANGINNARMVVGQAKTYSGEAQAYLWQKGKTTWLGTLGGADSVANAINKQATIVGTSRTPTGTYHAFVWEKGVMHDLAVPGATYSEAFAINNKNAIVGNYRTDNQPLHAVLWKDGKIVDLDPQQLGSEAHGINNLGAIVGAVTHENHGRPTIAVIWEDGKMKDLNPFVQFEHDYKFYHVTSGNSINDNGQILATGCNEDICRYFILSPKE